MDTSLIIFITLAGFVGGITAGMYGVGGGVVYTFILSYVLNSGFFPGWHFGPEIIIANSLVGVLFSAISSSYKMHKTERLPFKEILQASVFAVISSLLIKHFIVSKPWYDQDIFRGVLLALISFIVIRLLFKQQEQVTRKPHTAEAPVIGGFGGAIASVSGFGGGIVMIPIMLALKAYTHRKARAISLGVIVINSAVLVVLAFLNKSFVNTTNLPLYNIGVIFPYVTGSLVVGSFLGGPVGVKIAQNMKPKALLNSYLIMLSFTIIYYSYKLIL